MFKNKIKILSFFIFCFTLSPFVARSAVSSNYVSTKTQTDVTAFSAKLSGETASSTVPGFITEVYFEYGNSTTALSSSTVPVALSSGTLSTAGDVRIFSATVNDLIPNTPTHFRIVRKVSATTGSPTLYKGAIQSFRTEVNNLAPYVYSFTAKNSNFTTSDCDQYGCTIEIPENLPKYTTIANVTKRDPNNDEVTLSIVSGNTQKAFEISTFGDISVSNADALDFETRTSFTLGIELKDSGKNRLTFTYPLKVNLKDITNESKPLSPSYTSTGSVTIPSYTYTGGYSGDYSSKSTVDIKPYKYTAPKNTNYTSGDSVDLRPYQTNYNSSNNYNYTSGYGSSNSSNQNNEAEIARLKLIKSLLEQIAALQAELDRRIRLGLP